MFKYILKRIFLAFITMIIIMTLVFVLVKMLPVDKPVGNDSVRAAYWSAEQARGYIYSSKMDFGNYIDATKTNSGSVTYWYQVSISEQYFKWVGNILTKWDWGTSQKIELNISTSYIIAKRLPTSIKVNFWAALFSIPLGILLGIWAALKKNKPTDTIISTLIMVFISIPSFVLVTFLIYFLCYKLNWLPSKWPNENDPTLVQIKGYILPVMCLSFGSIAGYGRITRAELCEVMQSEYLLLARTKGLTNSQAIRRHALKNAMVPIFPSIIAEIISIFTGGSMIIESLYNIPGTGTLYINAINQKDWNVMFVVMAFSVVIGLLSGILLDISYGFIDPRIRMGAKK